MLPTLLIPSSEKKVSAHCTRVLLWLLWDKVRKRRRKKGQDITGHGTYAYDLATNQAANFTAYQEGKKYAQKLQNLEELPSYQHLILGGISGAMGPLSNAPIDTIKTRIQKSSASGKGWERFKSVTMEIYTKEGMGAFYKGLTPRVLRVAPGQAVTFMVYEKVKSWLDVFTEKVKEGEVTQIITPQK